MWDTPEALARDTERIRKYLGYTGSQAVLDTIEAAQQALIDNSPFTVPTVVNALDALDQIEADHTSVLVSENAGLQSVGRGAAVWELGGRSQGYDQARSYYVSQVVVALNLRRSLPLMEGEAPLYGSFSISPLGRS